eukprot:TRINITY_DN11967_c0_g1_i1.p1 TRINITY_DN11967_c0_g1~~TRINITY_DN11967_c0_g1_i1.p1  ORF type:complete len:404 (+),score=87.46 TRINITY_DN11967_c0_g1_i1:44-1255(+)
MADTNVIKSGVLSKLALIRGFRRIKVTLTNDRLQYSFGKRHEKEIKLFDIMYVRSLEEFKKKKYVFQVFTFSSILTFAAKSLHEVHDWVSVLDFAVKRLKGKSRKHSDFAVMRLGKSVGLRKEDFQIVQMIGEGNFGEVYSVRYKGMRYAMKVVNMETENPKYTERLHAELYILSRVRSPFVAELKYCVKDDDKLCLIMKEYTGGELSDLLEMNSRFPESVARFYASEILLALQHLHSKFVLYRDLKPENILLDQDGHVVLIDFGLSKILESKNKYTNSFVGTPEYLSPEIIQGDDYSFATDFWCFGCLVYEMLVGIPPFEGEDFHDLAQQIVLDDVIVPHDISQTASDFIMQLTNKNMDRRLTNIEDIKNHPFFEGVNWELTEQRKAQPPLVDLIEESSDLW